MKNNATVEVAIKAAISAGLILKNFYSEKVEVSSKESSRDIVSEVDHLAEKKIIEILKEYDDSISIITEEQGTLYSKQKDKFWLIDPLDGTVNYIHNIPFFCVSVAYVENGIVEAGAVYSPLFDDLFYGARSIGVFKNHKAINVDNASFKESLFAATFSGKNYEPKKRKDEAELFIEINDNSRGCLRTGSAALNLVYLAEGRFNGCFGKANKFWDIGAGLLIAELAGAKVEIKHLDKENRLASYVAAAPNIYDDLHNKTSKVLELNQ
jgi:myo-inositol-1(or 4)-monophosphatase